MQLKEVKCVVADDTVLVLLHGVPEHSKYIFLSEVGKRLSIGKLMTLLGT